MIPTFSICGSCSFFKPYPKGTAGRCMYWNTETVALGKCSEFRPAKTGEEDKSGEPLDGDAK